MNIEKVENVQNLRLLVVDDEVMMGLLLKKHTMEYGSTDVVTDGFKALKAFRIAYEEGKPYNLVFLDLMIPGMDGQAILKSMREYESSHHADRKADCRIIMITASREPYDVLEAYKNQCSDFLTKPLTWSTILAALQQV